MRKKMMMAAVSMVGLVAVGCNTEGGIVVGGVVAGLTGGIIALGQLILQLFGVVQ